MDLLKHECTITHILIKVQNNISDKSEFVQLNISGTSTLFVNFHNLEEIQVYKIGRWKKVNFFLTYNISCFCLFMHIM